MKNPLATLIILLLAISLVLFVFVPATFMFLGKIENPLSLDQMDSMTPQYSNTNTSTNTDINTTAANGTTGATINTANTTKNANQTASAGTGFLNLWRGGWNSINQNNQENIDCTNPDVSYLPNAKDARLERDDEESIIKSGAYKYSLQLPEPIYDWAFTKGELLGESASFVYKNTIVHILARTSTTECNSVNKKTYQNFHSKNGGVEFFSSRVYLEQNKYLKLTKAILQTYGEREVNDKDYYWYVLDEEFNGDPNKAVSTLWYSTRIGRIEYWFAFRTYKEGEDDVEEIAEEVLDRIEFGF